MESFVVCRALKAQEAAKKAARLAERQQGGPDTASRAPTSTQTKEDFPNVRCIPALFAPLCGTFCRQMPWRTM